MKAFLIDLRPLRVALYGCIIIALLFKPAPHSVVMYEGWGVFSTILLPVLSPILLMLLWLDSIIAGIWVSQTEGRERQRYVRIFRIDLGLSLLFLLLWIPYFKALLEG